MNVSLHRINRDNWRRAIQLELEPEQQARIATNVQSIAEAYVDPTLRPFLIYPSGCNDPEPKQEPVGFLVYEVADCGIGFLFRLMIDRRHQVKGYGRAAVTEVIRRLRLEPLVQRVATSHRSDNEPASRLFRSLGFIEWDVSHWRTKVEGEVFLTLPEGS